VPDRSTVRTSPKPGPVSAPNVPSGLPSLDEMLAGSQTEITAVHIAAIGTVYELARAELARRQRSAHQLAPALGRTREVWARLRWEQRVNALAAGAITPTRDRK
jgi:hypothetical protein